jgi:hypothetical protein
VLAALSSFVENFIEMKRSLLFHTLFVCLSGGILGSCNFTSPEKNFDIAVLNSNMLVGFAGDGQLREIESPSVRMVENSNQTVPIPRAEIVEGKISFVESNLAKLKDLRETPDNVEILQSSIALHEYILPVYKNEYLQLAKMYDQKATKEQIEAYAAAIHDKYYAEFDRRYNRLINAGKQYASRHDIKVNWAS